MTRRSFSSEDITLEWGREREREERVYESLENKICCIVVDQDFFGLKLNAWKYFYAKSIACLHNLRKKEKQISRVSQKCWWIQVILICMLMKIRRQWKKSNLLSWSTRSCSTPKTWYIKGAAKNWMCKCHQYRAKTHANMTASYEQWQKWMWNYILTYKSNLTEILWIKTTQKRVHWCIKQMQRKKRCISCEL